MVDLATQLSEWTFDKPVLTTHPQRTSSAASSPNLCDDVPDTLRLDTAAANEIAKEGAIFNDRYNSSEEDLTTAGSDSESEYDYDDVVIYDPTKECKARTLSVSRWNKGKSCDMAVTVSYAFAGRPKVVEDCRSPLDRPAMQLRSASLAHVSAAPMHGLKDSDKTQRQSMTLNAMSRLAPSSSTRPSSPVDIEPPRRPSTSYSPATKDMTAPHDTASVSTSFTTAGSSRSVSPAYSEVQPSASPAGIPSSSRSSVYAPNQSTLDLNRTRTTQSFYRQSQLAPQSPALSFLSSDPYENSTTDSSSPIIKKAGHRRLRSISLKIALAKIAISPAKKQFDARANSRVPSTPLTPSTPQTAPLERPNSFTGPNKLRRASTILRPKSRQGENVRYSTQSAAPPLPQLSGNTMQQRTSRMVARGANEIEPTLVLPDFPPSSDDEARAAVKNRALRKRKSLMDFMDSLA
ncbi:hypothetical protein IAQ61_011188 [Plenodomus lingam]|uniref:Uncharacterized protein n=1 Tax=Leptosphaeria maculans (strain JN3 / isolate v23.1.3 / race Av1-4-5-6-7-8) TaxID=985895 RepID=E5A9B2_LEPMJ|nr:hypothetical protein LEMA_P013830.1 [Plenodomus lingam JN3]KAH9859407.1 hypothetical protein IAQ61_011188 [Plenodomus lingam]CBY00253.1 hypothetical protein LEMA_P013830.1 [Plenodomus lingam JN3]